MSLVKWMISTNAAFNLIEAMGADNVVAIPPEKLLPNLAKTQPGMLHYTCPAFVDTFKNTYIFRAPFDVSIKIDPVERTVQMDKDRDFVEKYLQHRVNDAPETENVLFSLNHFLLFVTDDDIEIETIPCYYHQSDFVNKVMFISGKFNIRDWVRNVEVATIVKNSKPENKDPIFITIKRGDPLFYIRFHPKDGSVVKLEQEFDFDKIEKYTKLGWVTTSIKKTNPHTKLAELYKMFSPFRRKNVKASKCPFNFRK